MVLDLFDVTLGVHGAAWHQTETLGPNAWKCGFCDSDAGSDKGYAARVPGESKVYARIYICPICDGPTLFTRNGKQFPLSQPGGEVEHVPKQLDKLYNEARSSTAAGAFTAAVMVCRKMLLNIAHEKGAGEADLKYFVTAVNWLDENHYIPPGSKPLVDYIKDKGNEANHEIALMSQKDAETLVRFVEHLLRTNYEVPNLVPSQPADADE